MGVAMGIAFERRSSRAQDHRTRGNFPSHHRQISSIIADPIFLLVGGIVLFIDHNQTQVGKWRKYGRTDTDHNRSFTVRYPPPLCPALTRYQRAVQHRYSRSETLAYPFNKLMGEADFWYEYQYTPAAVEGFLSCLQIHLSFSTARDSVQEKYLKDGGTQGCGNMFSGVLLCSRQIERKMRALPVHCFCGRCHGRQGFTLWQMLAYLYGAQGCEFL